MTLPRTLALSATIAVALLSTKAKAQRKPGLPSIAFGGAQVSVGMTREQVERNLAESARHMEFVSDKHTALVRMNNAPVPSGDEGQVTFVDGRVVYAAFSFPEPRDAEELAQELAGAVDGMDSKLCMAVNFSGHGTGGGYSQTAFTCGPKGFNVMTTEIFGHKDRHTHVEITIGAIPRSE